MVETINTIMKSYLHKYINLIKRAEKRGTPNKIFEAHHVIPRCLKKHNNDYTVNLTVAEHILAHKYLSYIFDEPKLKMAYYFMINSRNEKVKLNEVVKAREKFLENVLETSQAGRDIINNNLTDCFLKDRAKKISLGKWGKVKLEYNNLCYYNKKYIAEDYNVSIRTITNWIKSGKVLVIKNQSITYDKQRRNAKSNA